MDTPPDPNRYQRLPFSDIYTMLQALQEEFDEYLQYGLGYRKDQYVIFGVDIIDTIIRFDKRKAYFEYFHDMKINDVKKAALLAYWIVKFRPVKIIDNVLKNQKAHVNVNEKLAINHLLAALVRKGKIKLWDGTEGVKIEESKFFDDLSYSFRFRNVPIDVMIVLADSITTDSFKEKKKNT